MTEQIERDGSAQRPERIAVTRATNADKLRLLQQRVPGLQPGNVAATRAEMREKLDRLLEKCTGNASAENQQPADDMFPMPRPVSKPTLGNNWAMEQFERPIKNKIDPQNRGIVVSACWPKSMRRQPLADIPGALSVLE